MAMVNTKKALFLLALMVTLGCDSIVSITGPDGKKNSVPVGAVFSVRNNEARTASPGFARLRVNGILIVERMDFGQVVSIDMTKVQFYEGKVSFSAEGYVPASNGGMVYLGCQSKTITLSQAQRGLTPWAFNNLRLSNNC
jgi:hypothetical protein